MESWLRVHDLLDLAFSFVLYIFCIRIDSLEREGIHIYDPS